MNYEQVLTIIRFFVPTVGQEILKFYKQRETMEVITKI